MSKDDLVKIDGKITTIFGGGVYGILLDNGLEITAKLCGKMKNLALKLLSVIMSISASHFMTLHAG